MSIFKKLKSIKRSQLNSLSVTSLSKKWFKACSKNVVSYYKAYIVEDGIKAVNTVTNKELSSADLKKLIDKKADYEINTITDSSLKKVKDRPMPYLNPSVNVRATFTRVSNLLLAKGKGPLAFCSDRYKDQCGTREWTSYCALKFDDLNCSETFFMKKPTNRNPEGFCEKVAKIQEGLIEVMKSTIGVDITTGLLYNLRYSVYKNAESTMMNYYNLISYGHEFERHDTVSTRRTTFEYQKIISLSNNAYPLYVKFAGEKLKSHMSREEFQKLMTTLLMYTTSINACDLPIAGAFRDGLFKYCEKDYPEIYQDYIKVSAFSILHGVSNIEDYQQFPTIKCKLIYKAVKTKVQALKLVRSQTEVATIKDVFGIESSVNNIYLGKRNANAPEEDQNTEMSSFSYVDVDNIDFFGPEASFTQSGTTFHAPFRNMIQQNAQGQAVPVVIPTTNNTTTVQNELGGS